MQHNILTDSNPFIVFIIFILLFTNSAERVLAGISFEEMQRYLPVQAELDDNELAKLKNGEMIAKLLPVQDKREVAVFGIVPVRSSLDSALHAFQETMARQNKKSVMESGSFSPTPTIDDLKELTLEKRDIEDLKQCRVGNCKVRLSEVMIERFQKEVDWNAPDYPAQANDLFRRMILEYVLDYLSRGNSALIVYSDQTEPVSLQKDYDLLLKELIWIDKFAPEFSRYLDETSRTEPPKLRKSLNWTKIKFGLKPVVVITQTLTYTAEQDGDLSQILSVSKQLYASHYFDSSLGLTALVKPSQTGATSDSFLLYTNRSRSSSLDGLFSKFKREIAESEALRKIKPLLQETKLYGEAEPAVRNELPPLSINKTSFGWLPGLKYLIFLILTIALIVAYGFGKQIIKRHSLNENMKKKSV